MLNDLGTINKDIQDYSHAICYILDRQKSFPETLF